MNLRQYIEQNRLQVKAFAEKVDISRQHLHELMNGLPCGRVLARKIAVVTDGKVTRLELLYPNNHDP